MPGPRQSLSRALLAVIVLAGLLTVVIPGFFVFGGHGSSLLTDRHGLPGDVPLPNGVTFVLTDNVGAAGAPAQEWAWTVASPNDSTSVRTFYQSNLPSNGWRVSKTLGSDGDYNVIGCKGSQAVFVAMNNTTLQVGGGQGTPQTTITAPAGGSTLQIITNSDPGFVSSYCG